MATRSPDSIVPGSVIRTCIGCGARAAKSDMLRIVAVDGEVVVDPAARRPGRGAYLHPSPDCVERARRRRAIPRALRATGPLADGGLARYLAEA
ncbi:MAG TPA: YlxR family protein [Streptosporangiaceae bacterium]|nr:YlxR family protein [Streptosporangiaceae bacterium]